MDNMHHYNKLKTVPRTALREINFGKLKGKSDINPQYRYEVMTEEFGTCGIGWKYEIVKSWTQALEDGQLLLFVEINLYTFDLETDKWSAPIPAIGGDFLIEKDKNGIHGNDEAYKMATTDALGVAMKYLGVAADVYRGLANDTKYGREPAPAPKPPQQIKPPAKPMATAKQLADMVNLAKEKNVMMDMPDLLHKIAGVNNSKELTLEQADMVICKLAEME